MDVFSRMFYEDIKGLRTSKSTTRGKYGNGVASTGVPSPHHRIPCNNGS